MASDEFVPVVIGVGDFTHNRSKKEVPLEPLELICEAFGRATKDTGLSGEAIESLIRSIDSVNVVRTWTWPYPDLAGSLASRLKLKPKHTSNSEHGGNSPALLFDEAARRVSKGESKVAIIAGAEALNSLSICASQGKLPPPGWTEVDKDVTSVFTPTSLDLTSDLGAVHSIGNPIHIYPLYENGLRAHKKQTIKDNNAESAQLYADFAKIAEKNEYSWTSGQPAKSAQDIGTVSKKNRMICLPYPLLMNAFNNVDMAAVCIVTSLQYAKSLGISSSNIIYAIGGAGTKDADDFWNRPNFYSSPAISRSLDSAIEVSGITKDDIDIFDFYSCFPIVPKLCIDHLFTSKPSKPISLLGGLTSFGGAGNNYSLHAINAMVRELRAGSGKTGLILANGGVISYQHVICLSRQRRTGKETYPEKNPLPARLDDVPVPKVVEHASGEAVVEAYTVEFERDGTPGRGHIVGRLMDGRRFIANHADEYTLKELCSTIEEPIGKKGIVKSGEDGRNLFSFDSTIAARL